MSTPLGQLEAPSAGPSGGSASAKPADVELIESQLMNNDAASLSGRDVGSAPSVAADAGALPTAMPNVAFAPPPAPHIAAPVAPMGGGHYAGVVPPAMPPASRGALDDYAFPIAIFIMSLIVLSPFIERMLIRFMPPYLKSSWGQVLIKAGLITAGFLVLDKLNQ